MRRRLAELNDPVLHLLCHMSDAQWSAWRHNPVTQAFLRHLADQEANWREAVMDLWEIGRIDGADPRAIRESSEMRGRVLTLKELRELSASDVRGFYTDKLVGEEPVGVTSETETD